MILYQGSIWKDLTAARLFDVDLELFNKEGQPWQDRELNVLEEND